MYAGVVTVVRLLSVYGGGCSGDRSAECRRLMRCHRHRGRDWSSSTTHPPHYSWPHSREKVPTLSYRGLLLVQLFNGSGSLVVKVASLALLNLLKPSFPVLPHTPSSQPRPGHPDDPPAADCIPSTQPPDPLLLPGAEGEVWVLELSTEFRESFHNIRRIIGSAYMSTFALKNL